MQFQVAFSPIELNRQQRLADARLIMIFKALGIILVIYTVFAANAGSVYAKRGVMGHSVEREDSPTYFWLVIGCYAALAIALLTVF